jgi:hypothetical protein
MDEAEMTWYNKGFGVKAATAAKNGFERMACYESIGFDPEALPQV